MYPLILKPELKDYIWGGRRLINEFGKEPAFDRIAESWELSCHKMGANLITNGKYRGMLLPRYLEENPNTIGDKGKDFERFPLLVKLIDANDNLSVQVHPDDEYALREEGEYGKTEMWYIVDCEPGASLIYGFNKEITKDELANRINSGTLLEACNSVEVEKGDVFFIPAGTIHAIGKGILIAEIQQSSNTTYRVFDYGRKDSQGQERELHVKKALDVMNLRKEAQNSKKEVQNSKNYILEEETEGYTIRALAECKYFSVRELKIYKSIELNAKTDSFHSILVIEGAALLQGSAERVMIKKGDSIFIPAGMGTYRLKGNATVILSKI